MTLRSVNLNLLPILQALLDEVSVTRAATRLNLSQSAVSDALARLRATLGDPLLVRTGSRMALTARAAALATPTRDLCRKLEEFFVWPVFDPATTPRTFVVATADYGIFLAGNSWIETLGREAPNARLRFVESFDALATQLAERTVDFALIPDAFLTDLSPAPLRHISLGTDAAVAVFRAGHPLAGQAAIEAGDLDAYRLIAFHPGSPTLERKRAAFFSGGREFDAVAFVPLITLAPYLLLDNDHVAILPDRLAARMTTIMPLATAPLAFAPERLTMVVAWSQVQDDDPGHRWFRERVVLSWADYTGVLAG